MSGATASIRLPEKLVPVFSGPASVRGAYGGRGSAKTRSFAKMSAVRAYAWGKSGREGIILGARQFMNSLDDSSLGEIKMAIREEPWLAEYFDIGEKYVRTIDGRIAYRFAGLDRNIDSIKSKARILLAWVDEAEPVTETAWEKLIPTLREEDSELWATWNPEIRNSATDKRFRQMKDPLMKVVEMNWRDNPWFPEKLNRDRLRDKEHNPKRYAHIWEGAYDENPERSIFSRWTIGHVAVTGKDMPLFGLDFGFGDPLAAVKCYYLPRATGYGVPVVYVAQEAGGRQLGNEQIAPVLDKITEIRSFPITADSSRPETIEYLGAKGFMARPSIKGAGSVKNGITWLQGVHVVIAPDCTNLIDEFGSYKWKADKTGKVLPIPTGPDHYIDALRYAVEDIARFDPDPDEDDGVFLRF